MSKKITVAVSVALVLIVAAIGIFFYSSKKITVAFYNIGEKQKREITATIEKTLQKKNFTINTIEFKPSVPLSEQITRKNMPDILFTLSGYSVQESVEIAKLNLISPKITSGMTSSMRTAIIQKNGKSAALPILSSHFELDIDLQEFQNSETKQVNTWSDVEKFMREQKRRKEFPLVFAGGNPDFLLTLLGALAESIDGIDSYTAAVKILKEEESPAKAAEKLCDEPDSPLATSIRQLKSWYKQGFIHPGVFSFQQNDTEAFASNKLSSVMILSLEDHRNTPQETISRYTSVFFPSTIVSSLRAFTGNTYYAVPTKNSYKTKNFLKELVSTETQESLSRATGLAPVLNQCRTPDKQADDARYWITATTAPLAGLSQEVSLSKETKKLLAAEIAARIKQ